MTRKEKDEIICILMLLLGSIILVWSIFPVIEIALPITLILGVTFLAYTVWEYLR